MLSPKNTTRSPSCKPKPSSAPAMPAAAANNAGKFNQFRMAVSISPHGEFPPSSSDFSRIEALGLPGSTSVAKEYRMAARILIAVSFALALSGAFAQTPPDADKSAARETPPDQKAYADVMKITDPSKKIEALEKFRKDFPDSMFASGVDSTILSTLIQKMTDQKPRINKTAQAKYAAAVAKDKSASKNNIVVTNAARGAAANRIADQLLSGDMLLKDAESYARKGVDAMQQSIWIAEQREAIAKRKQ